MRTSIRQHWNEYQSKVMEPDCPDIQVTETRRAFYAGAAMMFFTMKAIGTDDAIGEDAGANMLAGFDAEIAAFAACVMLGAA